MNIDQATIDAVNACMRDRGMWIQNDADPCRLTADDVSALLAALAKCEPVKGLVRAANAAAGCFDARVDFDDALQPEREAREMLNAALAPFAGGGE